MLTPLASFESSIAEMFFVCALFLDPWLVLFVMSSSFIYFKVVVESCRIENVLLVPLSHSAKETRMKIDFRLVFGEKILRQLCDNSKISILRVERKREREQGKKANNKIKWKSFAVGRQACARTLQVFSDIDKNDTCKLMAYFAQRKLTERPTGG